MRLKIFFVMLLMSLNVSAKADWVSYFKGDVFESFYDPSSIMRNGNQLEFNELSNFKSPQNMSGNSVLSAITRYKVKCNEFAMVGVSVAFYEFHYGQKLVGQSRADLQDEWRVTPPNTSLRYVAERVCNKKIN